MPAFFYNIIFLMRKRSLKRALRVLGPAPGARAERRFDAQYGVTVRDERVSERETLFLALHCDTCQRDSASRRSQEGDFLRFFQIFSRNSDLHPPSPHMCPMLSLHIYICIYTHTYIYLYDSLASPPSLTRGHAARCCSDPMDHV